MRENSEALRAHRLSEIPLEALLEATTLVALRAVRLHLAGALDGFDHDAGHLASLLQHDSNPIADAPEHGPEE